MPAEHLILQRNGDKGKADYVDVVQVALLQTLGDESHPLKGVDLSRVSAFERLDLSTDVEEIDISGGVIEVEEIKVAIR